jgi:hypothetical protein
MAGRLIQVIPKSRYTFNNANSLSAIPISIGPRVIRTHDWVSGVLCVALHSSTFVSSSVGIGVSVYNAYVTPEEPNTLFLGTFNIGIVTFGASTPTGASSGALLTAPLSTIGGMLTVQLAVTQGLTPGSVTFEASVYLVGREN